MRVERWLLKTLRQKSSVFAQASSFVTFRLRSTELRRASSGRKTTLAIRGTLYTVRLGIRNQGTLTFILSLKGEVVFSFLVGEAKNKKRLDDVAEGVMIGIGVGSGSGWVPITLCKVLSKYEVRRTKYEGILTATTDFADYRRLFFEG